MPTPEVRSRIPYTPCCCSSNRFIRVGNCWRVCSRHMAEQIPEKKGPLASGSWKGERVESCREAANGELSHHDVRRTMLGRVHGRRQD